MRQADVFIEPYTNSSETIVQFSPSYELDKKIFLNVPDGYVAHIYVDEKPITRRDKGTDINLLDNLGKENKGKSVKVAFFRTNEIAEFKWGFGEIAIKNSKTNEVYKVGANGSYRIKIKDFGRLGVAFSSIDNITKEMLKEKSKGMFAKVGVPVLCALCTNTDVSALNLTNLIGEFKSLFEDALNKNENGVASIRRYGLELQDFTVAKIHVPDEDLERLRGDNKVVVIDNSSELLEKFEQFKEDILSSSQNDLKDELNRLKNEVAKISENQDNDSILEEIDNLKERISDALNQSNSGNLDNDLIREELEDIKNQINETNLKLQSNESTIIERIKKDIVNSSQIGLNEELNKLKEEVARIAEDKGKDIALEEIERIKNQISSILESNTNKEVDNNTILNQIEELKAQVNETNLKVIGNESNILELRKNYNNYQEFLTENIMVLHEILEQNEKENEKLNDLPLYEKAKEDALRDIKITTDLLIEKAETDDDISAPASLIYSNIEKNFIEKYNIKHDEDAFYITMEEFNVFSKKLKTRNFDGAKRTTKKINGKTYVYCPVIFRFLKAGLSVEDASNAACVWTDVNRMRHQSPENKNALERTLRKLNTDKKTHLKKILAFYREKGLYTKD